MSQPNLEPLSSIQFEYKRWRERFLQTILYITAGIGLIVVVIYVLTSRNFIYNISAGILFGLYLLLTFIKLPYALRAWAFLLIIYLAGLTALLDTALTSGSAALLLGWIALAAMILSARAGWVATGITLGTYALVGWMFLNRQITPWTVTSPIGGFDSWLQTALYTFLLSIMIVRAIALIQKEFIQSQQQTSSALQELHQEQANLSERVKMATEELSQRAAQLETANLNNARRAAQFEAIAQTISSVLSLRTLDQLLPHITKVISQQFGFYHVGVFLNDAENKFAVLMAANSPGGQKMLERQHKLLIGEQGIVGYVTKTGFPRVALNVGEDAIFFNNPDLPETRSEMALPLMIGGRIIGAIDVQSVETNAFDQEDIRSLTILANQISLAIENARLFEQTNRSLAEAETLYRQYLREGWTRLVEEEKMAGYRYTDFGVLPLSQQKSRQGKKESASPAALKIPLNLRGETVGTLIVRPNGKEKLNQEQIDIVNAVAERIALSAENARLFEETSRRAERERTVSQITTNIRSTTDPEEMIQTALDELKRVLGAKEVVLRPYAPDKTPPAKSGTGKKSRKGA
jgi:GAF domain-containing protein